MFVFKSSQYLSNAIYCTCHQISLECVLLLWSVTLFRRIAFVACIDPLIHFRRFQILACGYINSLIPNKCWLIQLFSLACTIKNYNINTKQEHLSKTPTHTLTPECTPKHTHIVPLRRLVRAAVDQRCELPSDEAGIIWDSICFAFLLLQRRVFMSYYFLHVVADIRASQILASR